MISFLISTYNYDSSQLLHSLDAQCQQMKQNLPSSSFDYEIILGDDASTDYAAEQANHLACTTLGCRYLKMKENGGQARLRNALAQEARYPYLVFIDSDAALCTPDYVYQYWQHRDDAEVVVGALRNPLLKSVKGHELRYRYERAAESSRTVQARSAKPYACFTAFNLLIHRDAFMRVRFDEQCKEYGYEDVLFGIELQKRGISIAHIDNPLVHMGIDTNQSFLAKTETALRTLSSLPPSIQSEVGASRWEHRLHRFGLNVLAAFVFTLFRPLLRANLLGRHPSLLLFSIYKLGYYCKLVCHEAGRPKS